MSVHCPPPTGGPGRGLPRRILVFTGAVVAIWAATSGPSSADEVPTITAVTPGLVLAGDQVTVDAIGFPADAAVAFTWDGVPSADPPAPADGAGALSAQQLSVPANLRPGAHDLVACAPATNCSGPALVQVGPVLSMKTPAPLRRGDTVTVSVAGLHAGMQAILAWNGDFAGTPVAVTGAAPFDWTSSVPAQAPANSVLEVCAQEPAGGAACTAGTVATLPIIVSVPDPLPPPGSSPVPRGSPPASRGSSAVRSRSPAAGTTAAEITAARTTAARTTAARTTTADKTATSKPTRSRSRAVTPSGGRRPKPAHRGSPTSGPPVAGAPAGPAGPAASPPSQQVAPVQTAAAALFTPKTLVHLEVVAFAILSVLGCRGMLRGIAGLAVPIGIAAAGTATSARANTRDGGPGAMASGDASSTWTWPGTLGVDAVSRALPVRVAPLSPLLTRVLIDGSYLRAMLGSAWLLAPAAGVTIGAAAALNTHGLALPPTLTLLGALAVLGVLDALTGFVAASAFVAGVAIAGGLGTATGVRTMVGLCVVCFAVPLIAGATRPLRRPPGRSLADRRRRVADVVIASLVGFWVVQKTIVALPVLAQHPLPGTQNATLVAVLVLGASVLRVALESAAGRWYPLRLAEVQPLSVPPPGAVQRISGAILRTGALLFVALAFIGNHWQLWAAGLLLLAPQVLAGYEHSLPTIGAGYRWLPRGPITIVVMLVVGSALGALALHVAQHSAQAVLDAFVLLAAASLALSVLTVFGREATEPTEGWSRWLGGVGVVGAGMFVVFGLLG